jgi:kumamolisin
MPKIPAEFRRIEGSERRAARGAEKLGPADPNEKFSVTIVLRRRPDGPPLPDLLSPGAMSFGASRRLSRDEFAAKYGASEDDIQRVTRFAEAHGLTVVDVDAAARSIIVSGTVAQMSAAFAVDLNMYRAPLPRGRKTRDGQVQQTYRGREGFVHVPADLAPIVVGVFGLDNRKITKRNATGDPPNTNTILVSTVTGLYGFPTNSAAGQTIAIFSETGYQAADITTYFSNLGAPFTAPAVIDISVDASNDGTAEQETTQDIVIASTVAQGARIAVYFTTGDQKGWVDLVQRVTHPKPGDPACSVLSSSFYISDGDDSATLMSEGVSTAWLNALSAAFQDAAIQGVTVCIASGDTGSDSKVGDKKAHVQYPASDPWVLACGGTTVGNISGSTFAEYVWNDNWGATGGGISDFFGLPAYQNSAGIPASVNDGHAGRGVPDVAANASPNSGYPIVVGGGTAVGNGTSASAPLYAGLVAQINAALGEPIGFLNPILYVLRNTVCRDISSPPGPGSNALNSAPGYSASAGWDACTGWGVIEGNKLLGALMAWIQLSYIPLG